MKLRDKTGSDNHEAGHHQVHQHEEVAGSTQITGVTLQG